VAPGPLRESVTGDEILPILQARIGRAGTRSRNLGVDARLVKRLLDGVAEPGRVEAVSELAVTSIVTLLPTELSER
jgi:hypothetical protein